VRVAFIAALVAAVGSVASSASAQQPRAARSLAAGGGRPTVTAVRAAQAPAIDGRLDDAVWRNVPVIDTFVQEEPVEGAPATERTEVRVAYDTEKLYFGIYAHYSDVGLRRVNRSDRDKLDNDDTVTVTLEPFLDYLRGYSFAVNGYGVQNDSMIVVQNAQSSAGGDRNYNALYDSGGQLTDDGWTAEIAIPIRSLRYPARKAGEAHRWGFQIRRVIKSKDESDDWSPISRNDPNFLGQIGTLTGMTDFSTQRNFELLPTFTASSQGKLDSTTGRYTTINGKDAGVGLKYGISSNMTFDFTYNPDFSQVESETQQIDINQRFPLNYAELRPFFLEGREIYEIAGRPQAVQTRRIVDPRYGAKLTGKVGNKTSIGLFLADDEAPGKVDVGDPAYKKRAQNVLGRVKYDLYRNAHVGMIFTDREFMNDHSRLLGADTAMRLGETGNFGYRFYKSDRSENGLHKTGWATEMSIRQNTRHLDWASIQNALSPDFGNQLSFIERVDAIAWMPQLGYQWFPETWIRNWALRISPQKLWDFDGLLQNDTRWNPSINLSFAKNIRLSTGINRSMERYRGIEFEKTRWSVSGSVNTSRKVLFSADLSNGDQIRFITSPFLGRLLDYGVTATFRPFSRLQSALKLDGNKFRDPVNHAQEFNVKILRSTTTYQFTPRLLIRNITELNAGLGSNHTVFENILVTYRVNSGTVFYVGYDDRYKEGSAVNSKIFSDPAYQRTNRAVFTKLQYLFRSGGAS
jgi:opacity protein-like surface antigen